MSGNLWKFSDKLDDEDIEILKHEFITYQSGCWSGYWPDFDWNASEKGCCSCQTGKQPDRRSHCCGSPDPPPIYWWCSCHL